MGPAELSLSISYLITTFKLKLFLNPFCFLGLLLWHLVVVLYIAKFCSVFIGGCLGKHGVIHDASIPMLEFLRTHGPIFALFQVMVINWLWFKVEVGKSIKKNDTKFK